MSQLIITTISPTKAFNLPGSFSISQIGKSKSTESASIVFKARLEEQQCFRINHPYLDQAKEKNDLNEISVILAPGKEVSQIRISR
jgi:hypothetical protein